MLISDVTDRALQAESARCRLSSLLHDENARDVLPPFPVRLTLAELEEWLTQAEESARKPRLAKAKKLLADNGIDATSIPADVLDKPDDLKRVAKSLDGLPRLLLEKARTALGAALTKGFADAQEVLSRFTAAGQALNLLEKTQEIRPWLYSLAAREVADNPKVAELLVRRAVDIDSLLTEPDRLGLKAPTDVAPLEQVENVLKQFNNAWTELNHALVKERLGKAEIPSLKGEHISKAQEVLRETLANIEHEKKQLNDTCRELLERLAELGFSVEAAEGTVAGLREKTQELRSRLEAHRKELLGSLGLDALKVLEFLSKGQLPPKAQVADKNLGAAIRRLGDAGYRVSLEVRHEDKRQ